MTYRVTAAMVTVTMENNRVTYLYAGDVVPEGVSEASIEHLTSLGFISSDEEETEQATSVGDTFAAEVPSSSSGLAVTEANPALTDPSQTSSAVAEDEPTERNAPRQESIPAEEESAPAGESGQPPAGNDSREEWEAYARSRGATDAQLEGKTRNEIRDMYR